uniref:Nanos-type domain-containing protein n=1 Tax=Macrostomum lignano TaxID=282301 RepID=A0A1I8FK55_9PLAT
MMQQQQQHRDAKLAPFESAASAPPSTRPTAGTCTLQHHQLYGDAAASARRRSGLQPGLFASRRARIPAHAAAPVAPVESRQQNKPGIAHEIDKWIASRYLQRSHSPDRAWVPRPNQIAIDKGTLLNFLTRLKMHYQKKREMRIELIRKPFHVYTSHGLTDAFGNVTCPVLFQYALSDLRCHRQQGAHNQILSHGNGNHQSGEQLIDQQPPPPQLGSLQVSRIAGARSSMSISRRG